MGPIVHELNQVFEERNLFLLVTLGLVSFSLRFRELAVRYGNHPRPEASPPRAEPASAQSDPEAAEEDPPVLNLLLGVASFTERSLEILERVRAAADAAPNSPPAVAEGEPITLRRLLG